MAIARTSKKDVAAPVPTERGRSRKTTAAGAGATTPRPEAPRPRPEEARAAEEALREARRELSAARAELAETRRQLQEAARQFLREFQEQLGRARQELREAARPREQAAPAAEAEAKDRLGVTVDPGVVVAEVLPGSPAAAAGLARGDVISAVNGLVVLSGAELRDRLQLAADGEEVTLRVTRAAVPADFKARLGAYAGGEGPAEGRNRLGARVDPGVVVAEVAPGSPAAAAGLARGDVIRAVNGEPVHSGEELRRAVAPLV